MLERCRFFTRLHPREVVEARQVVERITADETYDFHVVFLAVVYRLLAVGTEHDTSFCGERGVTQDPRHTG